MAHAGSRPPFLERIADRADAAWHNVAEKTAFLGEVTIAGGRLLTGRARFRRTDFLAIMQECGAQALPIISLISLLVGLILAFVGAVQLSMFGAQIYVASLVGIGIVRVMGAVMTGVIMAGRTGAAFAARLGTMQVNEEIDALATLGIPPVEFLVLPRILALALMMPLLCLYADLMGILGGLVVGVFVLDLNVMEYLNMTRKVVRLQDFWIGLFHSAVFGVLVALAGCLRGLQCGRSASAVGDATTSAVVTGIVSIVVATAVITVICNILGL
jgi:phospholipid/cholesterol/gamma-HCH transport system permease protein